MRALALLLCFGCTPAASGDSGRPRQGRTEAGVPRAQDAFLGDTALASEQDGGGDDALDGEDLGSVDALAEAALPADAAVEDDAALEDAAQDQDAAEDAAIAPDLGPDGPMGVCGDGAQTADEACDDGNREGGDYCARDCLSVTGRCGDGILQANETCDDGAVNAACDTLHDDGAGRCVAGEACAQGFVFVGGVCAPADEDVVIDIFVDNFCNMQVMPPSYQVPPGQSVSFIYRNRSRDYEVDVWMSYGGGFLDLPIGEEWDERFEHCAGGNRPRQAYADISTACSEHRFVIDCQ